MIVADANIVAYLFIEGDQTALAQAVLRSDPEWRLPPLWRHEVLNVLATFVRTGGASLEDAQPKWDEAVLRFSDFEKDVDPLQALALAVRYGISAYDAQYVALAEELDVQLVTQDGPLRNACPERAISMQAFCDPGAR